VGIFSGALRQDADILSICGDCTAPREIPEQFLNDSFILLGIKTGDCTSASQGIFSSGTTVPLPQ